MKMPRDEAQALETVTRRLTRRHPHCSVQDVESAVRAADQRLEGRPIRAFIPVLWWSASRATD